MFAAAASFSNRLVGLRDSGGMKRFAGWRNGMMMNPDLFDTD